jgi:hypothetical protein
MNNLYFDIKAKILDTIKKLESRRDPTPEEENTLLELSSDTQDETRLW